MSKLMGVILGFLCLVAGIFIYMNYDSAETAVLVKKDSQKVNEGITDQVEEALSKYEDVIYVSADYLESLVSVTISTSINGTDLNARKMAMEIKEEVDKIAETNDFKSSFEHYFIYITNRDGKQLVHRPVDKSFEEEIVNYGKKLTDKIPSSYSVEDATENGDITPSNITSEQRKIINRFIKNVENKKPYFIRFVQFSTTGDPIITEYQYNGNLIYYRWDSTRDHSGGHIKIDQDGNEMRVQEDYCKKLVLDSKMSYLTHCYRYDTIEF